MRIELCALRAFSAAGIVLATGIVSGQNYPNKPIRIVTAESGGGLDYAARLIVPGITGLLGQPVIIDNRPIGVMAAIVSNSPPDGHTLLFAATSFMIAPLLQKTTYDPLRDFSPITIVARQPNVLVVALSLPVASVKDLIALAKAKPGALNYASSGAGSSPHLNAEMFKVLAGVDIVHIPYKGGGPAVNALMGGEVQMMFTTATSVALHVKSGKVRALAVTGAEPSALAPGLPTIAASGLSDYVAETIQAILAPAKTPDTVITRLNREIVRVVNSPDVREQLFKSGAEAVSSSPEQLMAAMKAQISRLGKVVKAAGLKAD